ncbi:MAG TPA: hypothetical protein PLN24_08605, partial [Victivallales bacterium]|nr:hypothetical protein [Victivallales bacterium]
KFWQKKLDKAMKGIFSNYTEPYQFPAIDIELSSEDIFRKNLFRIANFSEEDDRIASFLVNFGPSFLPALAGAKFEWDKNTSWAHPIEFTNITELKIENFNPETKLWQFYEEKFLTIQERNTDWMMSICDMVGPFDILAGIIGTERLCIEMFENPDEVKRLASEAVKFWLQVYEKQYSILQEKHGTTDVFGLYMPGKGARWSEDFIALISPEMYEEFVFECDIELAKSLDTSYIHVHSAALSSIDIISKNPYLSGIEISNDPNGPELEELIKVGKKVVDSGKSLMMSNWQKDLSIKEIESIFNSIPNHSLIVTYEIPKKN